MPPWAGFCARWRCRPAGRHFSFCWYFCWYFSGKQAVYRGRCGSIHESNGFSTSSAHAKSTSAALQNSGFIGLQARRAKRRLRCQPARQPARQPLGKAPDSVLRRLLRCTVTAPKNTGWRVNRRLLTPSFDAYRLAYRLFAHQRQHHAFSGNARGNLPLETKVL